MRAKVCCAWMLAAALAGGQAEGLWAQGGASGGDTGGSVIRAGGEVSFGFEHPGLPVPAFTLTVRRDGTGTYQAVETAQAFSQGRGEAVQGLEQRISRQVRLSPEGTEKIFGLARDLKWFNEECATKAKNIADTGTKTLSYKAGGNDAEAGGQEKGSCVYNYSEDKRVQELTNMFEGIAFTLDEGRRLQFEHRFDRLGLDAEMESLEKAVAEKRACEVGTIADVLNSIAEDTSVMQRVRTRAVHLMGQNQASR